jgi:hypothetical protein
MAQAKRTPTEGRVAARRHQAGNSVAPLLLLLVLLVGAGAWNYHRNLEAEGQEPRPYRGYSDDELTALLGAYEARQETQSERYEAVASRRAKAQGKAYFDEQVREFERVQRTSRRKAEARDQLAGTQVVVKQIKAEQAKRAAESDQLMLFLKRAFTF